MGKDNFFKARMTDEQVQTLEDIVKEIQADTPEANVTASSVARYALEKYIDDYRSKIDGTAIVSKISVEGITGSDIADLSVKLGDLMEEYKITGKENISEVINAFNVALLKASLARLIKKM
ncbi:MAG: hypothetical protein M0T74_09055 [Desulfitobacterium hafniense]|uniref:hypothetical protein n=1 Tax=Desulfosporosinus sp. TaxID=157907 RepID=UPI00231B87BC|nr:hypothetical protein [Desulfosporosinus sp.]MCO5384433.1 hypothetical protein [Desulfosporosinus sp.]MDA8227823.1 hypothetical protein [Desulfitobacterium hafniense]